MNVVYGYITVASAGSTIHIRSFASSCRKLGHIIREVGIYEEPYAGGKETWSILKRVIVRLGWFSRSALLCFRLMLAAVQVRSDAVVIRFDPMHCFLLSLWVLRLFVPVVLEVNAVRSIEMHAGRPRISDIFDAWSLRWAGQIFVVSRRMQEHLVSFYGIPSDKIAIIENGVDVSAFNPDVQGADIRLRFGLDGKFVLGFVGSFKPWHGVGHLVELAARLAPALPDLRFLMVGDGEFRAKYECDIRERGLAELFVFTGHVRHEEIPSYLAAMDVLMSPHANEGFVGEFHGSPLKIFEYMAMGKPVVATPMGQISEVIANGESGILVDSGDPAKVAKAILVLHDDPAFRKRLGANARSTVLQKFTWEANATKVIELCQRAG